MAQQCANQQKTYQVLVLQIMNNILKNVCLTPIVHQKYYE